MRENHLLFDVSDMYTFQWLKMWLINRLVKSLDRLWFIDNKKTLSKVPDKTVSTFILGCKSCTDCFNSYYLINLLFYHRQWQYRCWCTDQHAMKNIKTVVLMTLVNALVEHKCLILVPRSGTMPPLGSRGKFLDQRARQRCLWSRKHGYQFFCLRPLYRHVHCSLAY